MTIDVWVCWCKLYIRVYAGMSCIILCWYEYYYNADMSS